MGKLPFLAAVSVLTILSLPLCRGFFIMTGVRRGLPVGLAFSCLPYIFVLAVTLTLRGASKMAFPECTLRLLSVATRVKTKMALKNKFTSPFHG